LLNNKAPEKTAFVIDGGGTMTTMGNKVGG